MKALFLPNITELHKWLLKNHLTENELWLGYYKKSSKKFNFSWSDSVDVFICFGWIDGLRKSIDEERYMIRITPRKKTSNWSKVNFDKANRLIENGQMNQAGLKAFELRKESKSQLYVFEQKPQSLPLPFQQKFKELPIAWDYFNTLSPSVKKQCIWWVISAKREDTKLKRLQTLIYHSEKKEKIPQFTWTKKKKDS